MGMDVYGNAPTAADGEYFRRNVWGWRPLAELVCELAPKVAGRCKYWQSNDGDGLSAADSVALADALQAALDDGRVASWIAIREATLKTLPNEKCRFCVEGVRSDDVGVRMGQPERVCKATTIIVGVTEPHPRAGEKGWCNGCDGRGWNPASAKSYGVDADDVREFAAFARASGGFRIL